MSGRLIRWSTVAVVVGLAIVAGLVSYAHARAVVLRYGETGLSSWLIPTCPDGIVYAASMVLLGRRPPRRPASGAGGMCPPPPPCSW